MTVRECYEKMGGDFDEAIGRLMKEERIVKYLGKFPLGGEINEMDQGIAAGDWPLAFRAVHTLKGMALNLSITPLAEASAELCDEIRPGVAPAHDITEMTAAVHAAYDAAVSAIRELTV